MAPSSRRRSRSLSLPRRVAVLCVVPQEQSATRVPVSCVPCLSIGEGAAQTGQGAEPSRSKVPWAPSLKGLAEDRSGRLACPN
eukprot:scaffold82572_cov35-Tisochrysis_lutea.AAC.1